MPTPLVPLVPGVLIDAANDSQQLAPFTNTFSGVFAFGGELYGVLFGENALIDTVQIAKSSNLGTSWSLLDSAHAPTTTDTAVWTLQSSTLTVGLQNAPNDPVSFVAFNLSSGLWTASTIPDSPAVEFATGLVCRNDGSFVLISSNPNTGTDSGLDVYVYSGGSWAAGIDLGAGLIAQTWYGANFGIQNTTQCTDGNRIYFASSADDGLGNQVVFAVALSSTNTVENLFVFPANSGSQPPNLFTGVNNVNGWPCLVGTTLILPLYVKGRNTPLPEIPDYPTLAASFDGGASWSTLGTPGVDPTQFATYTFEFSMCHYAPQATSDGTNLYLVYALLDGSGNATKLRLCVTTPTGTNPALWTWTSSTVQIVSSLGAGYAQWETPFLLDSGSFPSLILAAGAHNNVSNQTPMVFLSGLSAIGGGRVFGTFVGSMLAGQFSGGTK